MISECRLGDKMKHVFVANEKSRVVFNVSISGFGG